MKGRRFLFLIAVLVCSMSTVVAARQAAPPADTLQMSETFFKDIRVLTNHPKKVVALEGYGIRIADQVPLRIEQPKPTHQTL